MVETTNENECKTQNHNLDLDVDLIIPKISTHEINCLGMNDLPQFSMFEPLNAGKCSFCNVFFF